MLALFILALGTQYQVWWECHVVGIPIKAVDKLNFGLITVGDYKYNDPKVGRINSLNMIISTRLKYFSLHKSQTFVHSLINYLLMNSYTTVWLFDKLPLTSTLLGSLNQVNPSTMDLESCGGLGI